MIAVPRPAKPTALRAWKFIEMRRKVRRYIILALGWIFVLLGFVWLFLPPLPGLLFCCIGAILLSSQSARMRWLVMKLGRRYPKFRHALIAAKDKAGKWRTRLRAGQGAGGSGGH